MADHTWAIQDGQAEMNSVKRMKMGSGGNKGMILPFEPLHLTFHDVWYRVDLPKVNHSVSFDCL